MNQRDRTARFRVKEKSPDGGIEIYYAFGWEIFLNARNLAALTAPQEGWWFKDNASLRTCMRTIAELKHLAFISTQRDFKHCGIHERLADPIREYPRSSI